MINEKRTRFCRLFSPTYRIAESLVVEVPVGDNWVYFRVAPTDKYYATRAEAIDAALAWLMEEEIQQ